MMQGFRAIFGLCLLVFAAGIMPVAGESNLRADAGSGVGSDTVLVFVLGTDENLEDLRAVSKSRPVEICTSLEAAPENFSDKRLLFLASIDDEALGDISSTLNKSATVFAYNLSDNATLGREDSTASRYWAYGGKENLSNLISYLITGAQKTTAFDQPKPPLDRVHLSFVSSSVNSLNVIREVGTDPLISREIEVKTYPVSEKGPNSYDDLDLGNQEVIMLVHIGYPIQDGIRETVEEAKAGGARVVAYRFEDVHGLSNVNTTKPQYSNITEYWDFGGAENARRLISFLGANFCNLSLEVKPPVPSPLYGLYHPKASEVFEDTGEYLEWYNKSGLYNQSRPTLGILSYSIPTGDSPLSQALIDILEEKGANVIFGTYTYKDPSTSSRFVLHNESVVDAIITLTSFRLHYGNEKEGLEYLRRQNVTPIKAITSYSSPEEWNNGTGLPSAEIPWQIALPELDGLVDFDLLSSKAKDPVSGSEFDQPVEAQARWIADRSLAWARLHQMNNSEKKVAVIYYNHGGGKDNLGASYLDLAPSLEALLWAMNESGYDTEGLVPGKRELLDLMLLQGRNVGSWSPGELDPMVEKGDLALIPEDEYLSWFYDDEILSPQSRAEVVERWGPPPGQIMVYANEDKKYLVIPKISFGKVLIAPQPTRGWLQNEAILYHDKELVPHHQYIAFYLWLKKEFGALAIVHFGTHGTQEWLPGKETALSARECWPALLVQDVPVIYPYIMDNVGEGTQAKRRGNAVIVDHLTPPIVASGLYGNLSLLHQKMHNYQEAEGDLRPVIKEAVVELYLNLDLEEDLETSAQEIKSMNETEFQGFLDRLHDYLHQIGEEKIPHGLHILGQPPEGQELVSMVESMLGDSLTGDLEEIVSRDSLSEAHQNRTVAEDLLFEVLINGSSPKDAQIRVLGNSSSEVTEDLNLSLVYAEGLRGCEIEVPRVLDGLSGRYVPPRVGNDPIRNPDALPTGNNFYSFDSRLIPGEEAWEMGKMMADGLLDQYRREHNGTYPEKVAFVLWAVETMRHQGVMESEIFYLLGVRPVWDSKGRISGVELISSQELGRPRVDVLITVSGLYRDTFPDKIILLDEAVRQAAKANDTGQNYVRDNSEKILMWLTSQGYNQSEAWNLSRARVFSEAPGTYGTGLPSAVSASETWDDDSKLADLYIRRTGHLYGNDMRGASYSDVLRQNLAGVKAGVHSDSSNLYGTVDNDDFFQYLGGLSLAVRSVTGEDPDLYVDNLRDAADPKTESLNSYFRRELSSRYFNPRWIQGMMDHGYAGAKEMDNFVENLWGWEATVPGLVTESTWTDVYDVYVKDRYDLGLKEFFDQNNPWASQAMAGRMVETARKERWHPNEEALKELGERYRQSVEDYGVTCCHHTCGNLLLQEYMQGVLPTSEPERVEADSSSSRGGSSSSLHRYRPGEAPGISNQTRTLGVGQRSEKEPADVQPPAGEVRGYVMETVDTKSSGPSFSGVPVMALALVLLMLILIGVGFLKKR